MHTNRRTVLAGLALAPAVALATSNAWALDNPAGPVVLTLRGKVSIANDGGAAHFDMAMLEKMAQRSITTRTPARWATAMASGTSLRRGSARPIRPIASNW